MEDEERNDVQELETVEGVFVGNAETIPETLDIPDELFEDEEETENVEIVQEGGL